MILNIYMDAKFYHRNKDNLFEVDNIDIDRFVEK